MDFTELLVRTHDMDFTLPVARTLILDFTALLARTQTMDFTRTMAHSSRDTSSSIRALSISPISAASPSFSAMILSLPKI